MLNSYKTFFRLAFITYFKSRGTQARLTPKRFAIMTLFLPLLFMVQTMHWIGFFLDDIFFKDYRNIDVKEPLIITGVPRSGTTFLHRVLARDTRRFTTFQLWELIFAPAICERKFWLGIGKLDAAIGAPLAKLFEWIQRVLLKQFDAIHGISLDSPEEDYLALIPIFACFLLVHPFPFSEEIWDLAYFDERMPEAERKRIMAFYKTCIQRHLFVHGNDKRLLSKNPAFSPMIKSLDETFPDCKIICNIRSPLVQIPSLISSMVSGAEAFDNDLRGNEYRDQLLDMLKYFYRHLTDELPNWPENRHAFVTLDGMRNDLYGTVSEIYRRFGYEMSEEFEQLLKSQHEKSRTHKSAHKYSLEQFDLDPQKIREEFSYIFDRFSFDETST